jgi:hypothetical protein
VNVVNAGEKALASRSRRVAACLAIVVTGGALQ